MNCDYCGNPLNSNEDNKVFLIKLHNVLDWFCCEECRLNFMQEHFIDTEVDDAGHFARR